MLILELAISEFPRVEMYTHTYSLSTEALNSMDYKALRLWPNARHVKGLKLSQTPQRGPQALGRPILYSFFRDLLVFS